MENKSENKEKFKCKPDGGGISFKEECILESENQGSWNIHRENYNPIKYCWSNLTLYSTSDTWEWTGLKGYSILERTTNDSLTLKERL